LLAWQLTTVGGHVSVHSLRLLVCKSWKVIPVTLKRVGNIVSGIWVAKLENRVIIQRPVLSILVLTPNLLSLNTKDLDANAARSRYIVGEELWCE